MKNSAIYSMALATVLVLSLVDAEARGLGAGGDVQQQQAPRVQQQQAPRVQQQQAPQSSGRPGGHVATSAPSVSRLPQVRVQSPQRSQQVSRPSQAQVQAPQQQRVKQQQVLQQQQLKQQQASQQQQQGAQRNGKTTAGACAAARDTRIRYDAADARASAELSQSAQGREGWKAGPWNIRSSYGRRSSRNGAAAFG